MLHTTKSWQSQAANSYRVFLTTNPKIPDILSYRYRYQLTMVIKIGHYRQNIAATASKKGGIKSLGTVYERGAVDSALKP